MKRMMLLCCLIAACAVAAFAANKTFDQTVTPEQMAQVKRIAQLELRLDAVSQEILQAKQSGSVPAALMTEHAALMNELGRSNPNSGTLDEGGETCADPTDLGSALGTGVASGSTTGHTNDITNTGVEPACYQGFWGPSRGLAPDVTYRWTAPRTSTYTFSLCGSGYDTEISLWNLACPLSFPADYICGNDDAVNSCEIDDLLSRLECVSLEEGQQVLIVVDGYSTNSGDYTLGISDCNPVCAEAELNAPGALESTTCGAGRECDLIEAEDKQIAVHIPHSGLWSFSCSITGVNFDPYMFIGYECCTNDICSDDDGAGYPNSLCPCLELNEGTVYVTIEGLAGCGDFVLQVTECVSGRCCYQNVAGGPACATTGFDQCIGLGGVWDEGLNCEENPCGVGRCCYYDDNEPACESGVYEQFCLYGLGGEWTEGANCEDACPAPGDCGPIDLVFAVDVTGSMGFAIGNVVASLPNIINVANLASGGDLRLGLVTFDDQVNTLHSLTFNAAAVQASIAGLVAAGGAGIPEASDEALREILTFDGGCVVSDFTSPFRAAATKIIVLITDAPNGGCDDIHNPGLDNPYAHQRALDAAGLGVRISSVFVSGSNSPAVVLPALSDYALTSSGSLHIATSDGSGTGAAINSIIANCGQGELRLSSLGTTLRCDPLGGGLTTPTFDVDVDVHNDGSAECLNAVLELTNIGGDAGTAVVNSPNPVALGNILVGQTLSPSFNLTITPDADGGQLILTVVVTSDNCPPNFLNIVIDVPDCDSCDGDREIYFYEDDQRIPPACMCAYLCLGQPIHVFVCGEGLTQGNYPILNITPGCMTEDCNEECEPAQFLFSNTGWTLWGDSCWHNLIIPGTEGCICICFERYLPVELNDFSAVARSEEIQLNWSTASENANDHFELMRDGLMTANVAATNSASGANYTFVDQGLTNGRVYRYELVSVSLTGERAVVGELESAPQAGNAVVTDLALHQNYPNPFNPETSISFDLIENGLVTLSVYNPIGQQVATLVNGSMSAGRHTVQFNAAGLPSGLYFYRLTAGETVMQKKMLLLK